MGFNCERRIMLRTLLVVSILFGLATIGEMRPLLLLIKEDHHHHHHQWLIQGLINEILPKGENTTPTPNPCTNIPGQTSGGSCHN
ncbi:hypothetical protein CsatB_025189 [Cannabis sativa]